jgi:iron complex transport system ATP-binding protein
MVNELSGGECQLAVVARALATEAPLILLDEPTSDLDIKHALAIMDLLVDLKAKEKTIIVSVHDLNLARRYCDTLTIIYQGGVFFTGSPDQALSRENIKKVFDVDVTEIRSDANSFLYFQ